MVLSMALAAFNTGFDFSSVATPELCVHASISEPRMFTDCAVRLPTSFQLLEGEERLACLAS